MIIIWMKIILMAHYCFIIRIWGWYLVLSGFGGKSWFLWSFLSSNEIFIALFWLGLWWLVLLSNAIFTTSSNQLLSLIDFVCQLVHVHRSGFVSICVHTICTYEYTTCPNSVVFDCSCLSRVHVWHAFHAPHAHIKDANKARPVLMHWLKQLLHNTHLNIDQW